MHNSKFISILKTLNEKEFRQFNKYIRAPLFTQSEDVIRLYNYIRRYSPAFDSPKLERTIIFAKLFPSRAFDTARFSNLLHKLNKILEDYLIYLKYQQDDFQKKKLLTQIYGERNLNVIFKKSTEELLVQEARATYAL